MKLHHPKIEVIDGAFITPLGTHEITTFDKVDVDEKSKVFSREKHNSRKYLYIYGSDKNITISLRALPRQETLLIVNNNVDDYKLSFGKLTYYLNGKLAGAASTTYVHNIKEKTVKGKMVNSNLVGLLLPETLTMIKTNLAGNTLYPRDVELIEKNENNIHRLKIPFKIDDDEYLIDVSFKVKIRNKWTIGIPGGGP